MIKPVLRLSALFTLLSCQCDDSVVPDGINLRQEMRDFVIGISRSAKAVKPTFVVIPQNGIELVTTTGESNEEANTAYLDAIDGNGQEDLFYGYDDDDKPTPPGDNLYLREFLNVSRDAGNTILVTDYCSTPSNVDASYKANKALNYISFAANQRELTNVPRYPVKIAGENSAAITSLSQIKNFLYLISFENYATRSAFIKAITETNYDLVITDLFFHDGTPFTAAEINQLKNKANGGKRLVVAYMSIGEAENYRYYWQTDWANNKPSWLDKENPDWAGNFKVKYWERDWQAIIYGNENAYLKKVIDADFDGVYLDIIDGFEFYE